MCARQWHYKEIIRICTMEGLARRQYFVERGQETADRFKRQQMMVPRRRQSRSFFGVAYVF